MVQDLEWPVLPAGLLFEWIEDMDLQCEERIFNGVQYKLISVNGQWLPGPDAFQPFVHACAVAAYHSGYLRETGMRGGARRPRMKFSERRRWKALLLLLTRDTTTRDSIESVALLDGWGRATQLVFGALQELEQKLNSAENAKAIESQQRTRKMRLEGVCGLVPKGGKE